MFYSNVNVPVEQLRFN